MLLSIVRSKNVDQQLLVFFAYPISLIERPDVVFTDAAANTTTPPNFYNDPAALDKLNWNAIDSPKWTMPNERMKQMRMAEVLVHRQLDPYSAAYLVVWDEHFANEVRAVYQALGVSPPRIIGDQFHWFTHFDKRLPSDMQNCSIAGGPFWTKEKYQKAVEYIVKYRGRATAPRFRSLKMMLYALRKSLGTLPETAELIDLESDNEIHEHDVGAHTLMVVERLRASSEYKALDPKDKLLVELAAYLHDIGKGPKSRWNGFAGRQQVDADHPIRSVKMLQRILTEEVPNPSKRAVRTLCKLVCYHDFVGDIQGGQPSGSLGEAMPEGRRD